MIVNLFSKIFCKIAAKKIKKYFSENKVSIQIEKIKIVIPVKIIGVPSTIAFEKVESIINEKIDKIIEPKLKNKIDIELEIKK